MQRIPIPENWLNQYNFTPCAHTIAELEAHLIDHYHASRIVPNERQLTSIQEAVLREHLDDILLPEAMDIAMYRFALKSGQATVGWFEIGIERTTRDIYQLNFGTEADFDLDPREVDAVMEDLLLYLGVTQEDIAARSRKFLKYINTKLFYQMKKQG